MEPEWKISGEGVDYDEALAFMDARADGIHQGTMPECVWLLEHPPLYTAGTSAKESDLLDASLPVYKSGRGGQYTWHGPGQRVAYAMLNLRARQGHPDIKAYVHNLEEWIIRALSDFGIKGERRCGRVGIWVVTPEGEKKIAAIGVRVRRWVTLHGIAINVDPDLSHFQGIVPCGIAEHGVTSMAEILGRAPPMSALDNALQSQWRGVFETADSPNRACLL